MITSPALRVVLFPADPTKPIGETLLLELATFVDMNIRPGSVPVADIAAACDVVEMLLTRKGNTKWTTEDFFAI